MAVSRDLNRMMLRLLPYIMQQEQIEGWLQKSLAESREYERVQKGIQERALRKSVIERLLQPEMFKEYPYAAQTYTDFAKMLAPEMTELTVPEELTDKIASAKAAATRVMLARQNKTAINPEDIETMLDAFGYRTPYETIDAIAKDIAGEEERALRGREIGVQEKTVPIREREITVREKELEGIKTGKSKKELEERLGLLSKKEVVLGKQYKDIVDELGFTEGDPKFEELKGRLDKIRNEQIDIVDQLLGDVDKKKADSIVAKLKAGGATKEALEKHKERFMKEENLTETEYIYIKLRL